MKKPFEPNADYQPKSFAFSEANMRVAKTIIALYPPGRDKSAVMPLLDLAQRQVAEEDSTAGWIPKAALDVIAKIINQPKIKIYEVASFYSMYNTAPVGKYVLQVCTTTPCYLRGSKEIVEACEEHLGITFGETTKDGLFTLKEVECLGSCTNAPVVQINDTYHENLTPERIRDILVSLAKGKNDA